MLKDGFHALCELPFHRLQTPSDENNMSEPSFPGRVLIKVFKGVNKVVAWHKLPSFIGVFNLLAFRLELQRDNLHDVYPNADSQGTTASCPMKDPRYLVTRNSDGLFNELDEPLMGCTGMRFGRNVTREHTKKPTPEELLTPNPRVVSEQLLKRTVFKPATIVNLLAAAWIQFQLHDWVMHEDVSLTLNERNGEADDDSMILEPKISRSHSSQATPGPLGT